jgi:hypothetical protein
MHFDKEASDPLCTDRVMKAFKNVILEAFNIHFNYIRRLLTPAHIFVSGKDLYL